MLAVKCWLDVVGCWLDVARFAETLTKQNAILLHRHCWYANPFILIFLMNHGHMHGCMSMACFLTVLHECVAVFVFSCLVEMHQVLRGVFSSMQRNIDVDTLLVLESFKATSH